MKYFGKYAGKNARFASSVKSVLLQARCIDMAGKLANEWKTIKDGLVEPGLTSRSHPDYESSLDSDPGSES